MQYICSPAYKSPGTSVSRLGVITWQLRDFVLGPPCAPCLLKLLKLLVNSSEEDSGKLISAVENTH